MIVSYVRMKANLNRLELNVPVYVSLAFWATDVKYVIFVYSFSNSIILIDNFNIKNYIFNIFMRT